MLVFVDADNWPPVDFLERLAPLYEQGIDFVSVESRIANQGNVIGRFQQAQHQYCYGGNRRGNVGYTQAFSCRRSAAIAVGFPEQLPGFGGEDVEFFDRLLRSGYAWKGDFSIEVLNQVPDTVRDFWRQYRGRGKAVPYIEHRLNGWSLPFVTARRSLAAGEVGRAGRDAGAACAYGDPHVEAFGARMARCAGVLGAAARAVRGASRRVSGRACANCGGRGEARDEGNDLRPGKVRAGVP